jgi:hypothetical protein
MSFGFSPLPPRPYGRSGGVLPPVFSSEIGFNFTLAQYFPLLITVLGDTGRPFLGRLVHLFGPGFLKSRVQKFGLWPDFVLTFARGA